MKTVLVTGGSGFIGSHLCRYLSTDYKVINLDIKEPKFPCTYCKEDICNNLDYVFQLYKPDLICHLAAVSRVGECENYKEKASHVNIFGTHNVLQTAFKYNIEKFIFTSSSSVYGNSNTGELKPEGHYAQTKLAAEWIIENTVGTAILRPFNVYGPGAPTDGPYSPVVQRFIQQRLNGEDFTVVGDGKQTRDYVHVRDVCQAYKIVLENVKFTSIDTTFDVGTGDIYSVIDIVDMVSKAIPRDTKIKYLPRRNEPRHTKCNPYRLRELGCIQTETLKQYIESFK